MIDKKLETLHQHPKFNFRIHTLFVANLLYKEVSDKFLNDRMYKAFI